MGKSKRIALLGCGLWGINILRDLLALDCRVDVVDPSPESRRKAEALGAAETWDDIDDLPDVDGIIVATPATTHAEVIEAVLSRGVPIFCEKPFTTDRESAERLTNKAGDRLFVMHVWRYHPGVEKMAAIARTGELGPVELLRTMRTNWTSPRRDIDGIWTLAPHDLSIALEIFGYLPKPRIGIAEREGERPVGMLGILGDGPRLILEVSTRYADKRREVRMHCRHGVAVLPFGEADYLEVIRDQDGIPRAERIGISGEPPLRRELQAFLSYLDGAPPPRTSAAESLQIVAAMLELRQSAGIDEEQICIDPCKPR